MPNDDDLRSLKELLTRYSELKPKRDKAAKEQCRRIREEILRLGAREPVQLLGKGGLDPDLSEVYLSIAMPDSGRFNPKNPNIESKSASSASHTLPPTWEELRKQNSISQKEAAQFLKCDPRTIRRRLREKELKASAKGRIVCDERLRNQIRKLHGEHVLP